MSNPTDRKAAAAKLAEAMGGTLHEFFAANDVQLEPQQAAGFTALNLTLPLPP